MGESYHFIGIGGSGMSGLARLLLADGVSVTGSDVKESETVRSLRAAGARIEIGHRAENVAEGTTRVVYTAAVKDDNPELQEARRRGLPAILRAQMLGEVMAGKTGIAIAGTHGKTTTTGMAASVFLAAQTDPSILIGGDWSLLGSNARGGRGRHFLAEACEAFDSFLELKPHVAVLTNVEADHLDWHGSLEGVIRAFRRFLERVDADGYVVGCAEDENVCRLLGEIPQRTVSYAIDCDADYVASELNLERRQPSYRLLRRGEALGLVHVGVPGRHNVLNSLAVAAVALEEGLPFEAVAEGLRRFTGVERRFETLGEVDDILVLDDYAHHPTEVRATLAAAKASLGRPLTVVFQPHLFSRTQLLLDDFAVSFGDADRLFVTEIYPAREQPIPGITGALLASRVREHAPGQVEHAPDRAALRERLLAEAKPGDVIITMGAGDVRELGEELAERLRERGAVCRG
ncbi:MAG: UDP-N-acetylmuramate--L-alanine ligase [Armatimonadota bacterium]